MGLTIYIVFKLFIVCLLGDYVDRFVSENPEDYWHEDIPSFDDNMDFDDPQISNIVIDVETPNYLDDFGGVDFYE